MNSALSATEFLLSLVPQDGSAIGNQALLQTFADAKASNPSALAADFETIKEDLVAAGILVKKVGGVVGQCAGPMHSLAPFAKYVVVECMRQSSTF